MGRLRRSSGTMRSSFLKPHDANWAQTTFNECVALMASLNCPELEREWDTEQSVCLLAMHCSPPGAGLHRTALVLADPGKNLH